MNQSREQPPDTSAARDAAFWASPVKGLAVAESLSAGAPNLNVEGRRVVGTLQGFGQLWQKTYRVRLAGATVSSAEVVAIWKDEFPSFWPRGSHFYAPLTSIAPGEVAVLDMALIGGLRLSTGVYVIYADDEAFTFMCPEGHTFSGWITFSALEDDGATVAQVQVLMRANDPFYELVMLTIGHHMENQFWTATLKALAARFNVSQPVQIQSACVDARRQWSKASNIWQNAAIRTTLYYMAAPLRWVARPFRSGGRTDRGTQN